jgi:hypothetical protein
MTYYNTIRQAGAELQECRQRAGRQKDLILEFFKERPGRSYTPAEVRAHIGGGAPLTSIRARMTELTIDCKLIKTAERRLGQYGEPNFTWTLRTRDANQLKMF